MRPRKPQATPDFDPRRTNAWFKLGEPVPTFLAVNRATGDVTQVDWRTFDEALYELLDEGGTDG